VNIKKNLNNVLTKSYMLIYIYMFKHYYQLNYHHHDPFAEIFQPFFFNLGVAWTIQFLIGFSMSMLSVSLNFLILRTISVK